MPDKIKPGDAASPSASGSETRMVYRVAGYVTVFCGLGAFLLLMQFDWKIAAAWVLIGIAKQGLKNLQRLSPNNQAQARRANDPQL